MRKHGRPRNTDACDEKNDPRRTDANWVQIHLYGMLQFRVNSKEIEPVTTYEVEKHNAAIMELGNEFPELVV